MRGSANSRCPCRGHYKGNDTAGENYLPGRRIPVYATLLLATFLVGRWYVDTDWTTETIQAVAAGRLVSTAKARTYTGTDRPGANAVWRRPVRYT